MAGRTRLSQLEPRYFAAAELKPFLARLAETDRILTSAVAGLRRRPRRSGNPL